MEKTEISTPQFSPKYIDEAAAYVRDVISGKTTEIPDVKEHLFDFLEDFKPIFINWLSRYNELPNGKYRLETIGRGDRSDGVNPFYKLHLKEKCKAHWRITNEIGLYWKIQNKKTGEIIPYSKHVDVSPYLKKYKIFINFLISCGLCLAVYQHYSNRGYSDITVYFIKDYANIYSTDVFYNYSFDERDCYLHNVFIVNPTIEETLEEEPMVNYMLEYESE